MATDSDGAETVSVSTGAVTVEKSFSVDEFPVPTVVFDLRSTADGSVEVRLTDDVPDAVDMGAVGFHPDYDGDGWTAYRDQRVQYETTLEPGDSVRTVYGVRADGSVDGEVFLVEPRVELLGAEEGDADAGGALDRDTTQSVRDALAGDETDGPSDDEVEAALGGEDDDSDGVPTIPEDDDGVTVTEAEETTPEDDGVTVTEAEETTPDDPAAGETTVEDPAAGETTVEDPAAGETTVEERAPEDLAAALAEQVRAGDADDDDLAALRDALGAEAPEPAAPAEPPTAAEVAAELEGEVEPSADGVPKSVDVRIERLQSTVEDLAAYTDALETFLDEDGDGYEAVEGFREDVAELTDELGATRDAVESLESRVDELEDDLADTREAAEGVDEDVDEELEQLHTRVEAVDEETDDIEAEIERLNEFRDRLNSAFGTGGPGASDDE